MYVSDNVNFMNLKGLKRFLGLGLGDHIRLGIGEVRIGYVVVVLGSFFVLRKFLNFEHLSDFVVARSKIKLRGMRNLLVIENHAFWDAKELFSGCGFAFWLDSDLLSDLTFKKLSVRFIFLYPRYRYISL